MRLQIFEKDVDSRKATYRHPHGSMVAGYTRSGKIGIIFAEYEGELFDINKMPQSIRFQRQAQEMG